MKTAMKKWPLVAGILLILGCEGRDEVFARVERERLESEVVELMKTNRELSARIEEVGSELEELREENRELIRAKQIQANATQEASRLRAENTQITEALATLRSEESSRNPPGLQWTWEGNFIDNCGMMSVGGFPSGVKLALECHDPVIGKIILNGVGVDKAERLVFDPSTVQAVARGEKGVRVLICLMSLGGPASQVPSEWWQVTVVNE